MSSTLSSKVTKVNCSILACGNFKVRIIESGALSMSLFSVNYEIH